MKISDLVFKKVGKKKARSFIKKNHYTKGCGNAIISHGIYDKFANLVGVIAYQCPISENVRKSVFGSQHKDKVIELHRLVTLDECPKNTESWFISKSLDKLKKETSYWAVISFADATMGHVGKIYQASNAIYTGKTSKNVYYKDSSRKLRPPRQNGRNISKEEARERGWSIEKRESKYRYLFLLENGKNKKELKKMMKLKDMEYPDDDIEPIKTPTSSDIDKRSVFDY